ncbi:MAG: hypothetical protein ACRCTF_03275 [Bacteroidales bacterium]
MINFFVAIGFYRHTITTSIATLNLLIIIVGGDVVIEIVKTKTL